jgi:hypothetical protein
MTSEPAAAGHNGRVARRFFKRTAQVGALGCAALLFCGILFLVAVDPLLLRCSTWLMPVATGAWAPAWMLAPMVALWAVSMCFGAVRWGWFARLRARHGRGAQARGQYALTIDSGWLLMLMIAASALAGAVPILVAAASCYSAR